MQTKLLAVRTSRISKQSLDYEDLHSQVNHSIKVSFTLILEIDGSIKAAAHLAISGPLKKSSKKALTRDVHMQDRYFHENEAM